jgi:hypothetical protein
MAFKMAPAVPAATSGHQVHPVLKPGHALTQGSNIAVRHPATPGPSMMAPKDDYAELPSGSLTSTAPGGIMGGLAPFQKAKGATNGDFQAPGKSAKSYTPPPEQY